VLDANQATVSVTVYFRFRPDGPLEEETITGKFNVHRPTTAFIPPSSVDGTPTVMVTNDWLSLGWNRDRDMSFGHQIQTDSFCSGQAAYTQLIDGAGAGTIGYTSSSGVDGGEFIPFYDTKLDGKYGKFPPRGNPPSVPANTNTVFTFYDGPADGLFYGNAQMNVDFSNYLMFKPDVVGPGPNIYVPLRLVKWTVNDEADNYIYTKGNPVAAPSDNDCSTFPHWTSVFSKWF
jgi:hypothetical protein